MTRARPQRGFTLVECVAVCGIVAVLTALALPSMAARELRAARIDAVAALTALQGAQEQHRAHHGLYATELRALRGVAATSAQARYAIELAPTGPDAYRATAHAQGRQRGDKACAALTLEVSEGFASFGPDAACWNR